MIREYFEIRMGNPPFNRSESCDEIWNILNFKVISITKLNNVNIPRPIQNPGNVDV
jgi:hypothetical protein